MSSKPTSSQAAARRQAREYAIQVLYQLDSSSVPLHVDDALHLFWAHLEPGEASSDARAYCEALVRGVVDQQAQVDGAIQKATQHWRLERMTRVDRNVLRFAVYELLFRRDVPARVVLNEAIEVAKKFGSEESGAFVNGVLDRIARERAR